MLPDFAQDRVVFIFKAQQFFETSGSINTVALCHVPEDANPQQHR
jgi:hypothetical protein